jgi:DUF2971 family protein
MSDARIASTLSLSFERLRKTLWDWWSEKQRDMPETLYHYTGNEGLVGILSSRQFWATDARYLNDASEIDYACYMMRLVLDEALELRQTEIAKQFLESAIQTFNPYDGGTYSPFVMCFCEQDNLLSQWRAYGNNGYSIEFDSGAIARHPQVVTDRRPLVRVIYDQHEQLDVLTSLLDPILEALDLATADKTTLQASNLITDAAFLLRDLSATVLASMKHPSFCEEKEWRIIHSHDTFEPSCGVSFRTSQGMLAPYVKLDGRFLGPPWMGELPVLGVTHGPTPHPNLVKGSLRLLLHKNGYNVNRVKVLGSDVPLRG